jgi:hypothetical protein
MSFLYDPPLLTAAGAAGGALLDDSSQTPATVGITALFWGVSLPLWFDMPWIRWFARFWGAESGREFMLNSGRIGFGLLHFDPTRRSRRRDLVAVAVLLTYPLWFRLGWALGQKLRARPVQQESDAGPETLTSTVAK